MLWEHSQNEGLIDETPYDDEPLTKTSEHQPKQLPPLTTIASSPLLVVYRSYLAEPSRLLWSGLVSGLIMNVFLNVATVSKMPMTMMTAVTDMRLLPLLSGG